LAFTFDGVSAIRDRLASGENTDVILLPTPMIDAMGAAVLPGSRTQLARSAIGVVVHRKATAPDVSTVEKLAMVLKSADSVMYSNPDPKNGSMAAQMIDKMLNRPEFAGVKRKISPYGEGGQALARGEGQYALQLICEIVNHPDALTNAGPVPDSLGAYIDSAAAISSRALEPHSIPRWRSDCGENMSGVVCREKSYSCSWLSRPWAR